MRQRAFDRRSAPDLEARELIRIRARVYRVAGFNAYGQAMLEEVRHPLEGERERAAEGMGLAGLVAETSAVRALVTRLADALQVAAGQYAAVTDEQRNEWLALALEARGTGSDTIA